MKATIYPTGDCSEGDWIEVVTFENDDTKEVRVIHKTTQEDSACSWLKPAEAGQLALLLLEAAGVGTEAEEEEQEDLYDIFITIRDSIKAAPKGLPRKTALLKLQECMMWTGVALSGEKDYFDLEVK